MTNFLPECILSYTYHGKLGENLRFKTECNCRYDREDNSFRYLVDIQFVTAMGPPGGGRNPVTPRYMRHFNVLAVLDFEDTTLAIVFSIIYDWWARRSKLPHDVSIQWLFKV